MMKKHYNSISVNVILFVKGDVITSSGEETLAQDNTRGYGEWNATSVWED